MDRVQKWLNSLGLGQYAEAFERNAIGWHLLPKLNHELLREIGVLSIGHRMQILEAATSLDIDSERRSAQPKTDRASTAGEAERRQLTVMFADLVGSTELSQCLDPEDLREINRAYQDAAKAAVEKYGGFVARYMGDGVLAYFGYPQAHEDDAERAVHAGLWLADAVPKLEFKASMRVRIGIATGPVVVGDLIGEGASQESAVVGETPNFAARLQGLANPGTVLIGDSTHSLVAGKFDYEDLGRRTLKGISGLVRVWRVEGERSVESRFRALHTERLTQFVGREQEVELLFERWQRAKDGEGQVVLLSGEPGIGKSRIVEELQERVGRDTRTVIQYQCSPLHVHTALYPAIRQLEYGASFLAEDTAEKKLAKLEKAVEPSNLIPEALASIALLLSLPCDSRYGQVELTPQEAKQKTLEALVQLFANLAAKQPVLFVLEDAHWIDPTTQELVQLLVNRAWELKALLVITHRPEFVSPWGAHAHCTALTLNRLSRSQCRRLVGTVAMDARLPDAVLERIVQRTDGVPLFIEELTKSVLESEAFARNEDRCVLTDAVASLAIPATLQASLMARLDRLGSGKRVAQIGAVIGREFEGSLLRAIGDLEPAAFDSGLAELIDAGLLFARAMSGEDSYAFKHALVRDGAYESLLRARRRALHGQVAQELERRANSVDIDPGQIAYHFTSAGVFDQAVPFRLRAGQRAARTAAAADAVAHYREGLALLQRLPETPERMDLEVDLRLSLGVALWWTEGLGASDFVENFLRASACCKALHDEGRRFRADWGLWIARQVNMQYKAAAEISEELLGLARERHDAGMELQAHHAAWSTQFCIGSPVKALDHALAGVELYNFQLHRGHAYLYGGHDPGLCGLCYGGLSAWLAGYPERSGGLFEKALNAAHDLEIPSQLHCWWTSAIASQFGDEPEVAESRARIGLQLATEHGMGGSNPGVGCKILHYWSLIRRNADAGMVAPMRETIAVPGGNYFRPYYLYLLAKSLEVLGQPATALDALATAQSYIERVGEPWWESEIGRLEGELRLLSGQPADLAEKSFFRAIEISAKRGAKMLEMRATISLARFWHEHGKRAEAHDLLAPLYGWFTEGFDTPELKEARGLLEATS